MTLKHSKLKNTGLLFDILTQQVVSEALSNRKNVAYKLLQKHFKSGSILAQELKLYQAITKSQARDSKYADKLLEAVTSARQEFDRKQLDQAKYRLVGDLKKAYDLKVLLETKVPTYVVNANIYKLFEYSPAKHPVEYVEVFTNLQEHVTTKPTVRVKDSVFSLIEAQDKETKKLTHKLILEKFNSKYKGLLGKQKALLARYINTNTDSKEFKDYVVKEAIAVKNSLSNKLVSDTTLRIKLNEATGLVDKIIAAKTIQNDHLSALLKYYELDHIV